MIPFAGWLGLGGAEGDRTPDLLNAIQALSQLSYGPVSVASATKIVRAMIEEKCRGLQTLRPRPARMRPQKSETFCRYLSLTWQR